jgi:hypothetical protein
MSDGLVMTLLSVGGNGRTVIGIAPDSARKVVLISKGETAVASVRQNVFTRRDSVTEPVDRLFLR